MSLFLDVAFQSLVKYNEELCGDVVEVIRLKDRLIVVMADGLGSGVKANILATLTAKITSTMLKGGADIYETMDTVVNTLPICKERNIAYATFTLVQIYEDGETYLVEYENPSFILVRSGSRIDMPKKEIVINEKRIVESRFYIKEGDALVILSDGVVNAGPGNTMNMNWSIDNIRDYLERSISNQIDAKSTTEDLIDITYSLYGGRCYDDATVVTIKAVMPKYVDLFTGPPLNKEVDSKLIKEFMKSRGKKIICGGTAGNIAARELKRKIKISTEKIYNGVPPTGKMEGIDLITEGVVTLNRAIENIKKYKDNFDNGNKGMKIIGEDGASKLTRILINECTHLTLWIGKATNPAHKKDDFPKELSIKLKLIKELRDIMVELGKKVEVKEI